MRLSSKQLVKLADILADIGQVCLASIFIPFILDIYDPLLAATGLILACANWLASLLFIQRAHKMTQE